jgi:glycosyltransferase involved in cell wall biosynthesis
MNWPLTQRRMTVINPGRTVPEFKSRLAARTVIALEHPPLAPYTADVWFCILAELHPIKQHQMLFVVMKNIIEDYPHVRLICIGGGELQTDLQAYIENNTLSEHVFLVGPIHEAACLLKSADLFVLPSKSESYGYVLHEAGLARVPVVASNVGGIPDIISSEIDGTLIDPSNPTELEESLRGFLQSPHIFNERTGALQTKLARRTVAEMTKETSTLYESN